MSRPAPTRRQRLEAREDSIISAAYEELRENGFEGARMATIARRAGVAEGTVYLYFRNKDALVGAVVGRFYERLTKGASKGVNEFTNAAEKLRFLISHHLAYCIAEWSVLELAVPVLWRIGSYRDSEYIEFNRTYSAIFDDIVREGISGGDLRSDVPVHIMRDLFFGTLEHAIRTFLIHDPKPREGKTIKQVAEDTATVILTALGLASADTRRVTSGLEAVTLRLEAIAVTLEASA